jgi:endonuclease/exonuclease/phosphatase family metal-dependent hydrolase
MPDAVRRRPTLGVVALLCAALLGDGVAAAGVAERSTKVRQRPRARQVLVLAANVQEAWSPSDNADPTDLARFARRVSALAPHAPDVVLLQEVTRQSTQQVVRLLDANTNGRYAVAASAGAPPVDVRTDRVFTTETSILFNRRTMTRVGKPRFVATTHAPRHGARGRLREVKRNAMALLRERRSGITFPVVDVHFHTSAQMRPDRIGRSYRLIWVNKVMRAIRRAWPHSAQRAIVGGDFNAVREHWTDGRRVVAKWWRKLRRRGFRDTLYETRRQSGIDYVFARTRVAGAGVDQTYNPRAKRSSTFYSDHRLRWALLGRWGPRLEEASAVSSTAADLTWRRLPSVRGYRVERRRPGRKWRLADRTGGKATAFQDRFLQPTTTYLYRVIAWNGAERSTPSRVVRVRTLEDTHVPRRPDAPIMKPSVGSSSMKLTWASTVDRGGSGVGGYEVWRKPLDGDRELVGRTTDTSFVDGDFTGRRRLHYFIVAYDKVGNRSRQSGAATLVRLN